MADPDLEMAGGGGGGGGNQDLEIRAGGLQKHFFRPFGPHFGRKITGGPPGPSPGSDTAYRIGVYTIPHSFSCRPEKLWGIE